MSRPDPDMVVIDTTSTVWEIKALADSMGVKLQCEPRLTD